MFGPCCLSLCAQNRKLDASVALAIGSGVVGDQRLVGTKAARLQSPCVDSRAHEVLDNGACSLEGQRAIVVGAALVVGMTVDADASELGSLAQHVGDLVQDFSAAWPNDRFGCFEFNFSEHWNGRGLGAPGARARTAGPKRAVVIGIGETVAVVIEVRAAVTVLEAVHIFGSMGTQVVVAGHAVAVIVASIGDGPARRFREVRFRGLLRATVIVAVAVSRFGFIRTAVFFVFDSVLVVVGIGAAVFVLKTIEVFGTVQATWVVLGGSALPRYAMPAIRRRRGAP